MRTLAVVVAGVVMGVAFTGGCKSATQKQFEREQVLIAAPLEHDPTDRVSLARWWSNDTHLLRLDRNAAYALFAGHNRFGTPIETGRWSQQSYAVLWLEPYNTPDVHPRRIRITRVEGDLALQLPMELTSRAMFARTAPPQVIEDRLMGEWQGPLGQLHLTGDMRYTLAAADDHAAGVTQMRARTKGSWRVSGETLLLQSDVPGVEPLSIPLQISDAEIKLAAPGGEMNKAAATPAEPGK